MIAKPESDHVKQLVAEVVTPYREERGMLITVLQRVQAKLGYVPEEAIGEIARALKVSRNEIYGVLTFYTGFRLTRPGEHQVRVCLGTACHVRGGQLILEEIERQLGIKPGETSQDGRYSLERVACFGSCALAPVVVMDKGVHGRMTPAKAKKTLSDVTRGQE